MILFVFEGEERECRIYETLKKLFFPKDREEIIFSFGNNIYNLYSELKGYDGYGDLVSIMRESLVSGEDNPLSGVAASDITDIFLFFDYDIHNSQLTIDEMNRRVQGMLELFQEETENGKLYINYPMVESICYTKELPDRNYCSYSVAISDCSDFKKTTSEFSHYKSWDHLICPNPVCKSCFDKIQANWAHLIKMNVRKANYLVCGQKTMPNNKSDIDQLLIFGRQVVDYVNERSEVSVLNSFPIFIYDYLNADRLKSLLSNI